MLANASIRERRGRASDQQELVEMKRTAASGSGATIAIVAIAIGVAGCSWSPSSNNAASKTSTTGSAANSTTTAKPQSKVAPRITAQGPNPSIASYFQQSHITATPVHKGDPGAPVVDFPIPDGWADAGPDSPATAYWAIVDNGPEAANTPPASWRRCPTRRRCRPAEAYRTRRRRNEKAARFQANGRGL